MVSKKTKKSSAKRWISIFNASVSISWTLVTAIGAVMLIAVSSLISSAQSELQTMYAMETLKYTFLALILALGGHFSLLSVKNSITQDLFNMKHSEWFCRLKDKRPWLEFVAFFNLHLVAAYVLFIGWVLQLTIIVLASYFLAINFQSIKSDFFCDAALRQKINNNSYLVPDECADYVGQRIPIVRD